MLITDKGNLEKKRVIFTFGRRKNYRGKSIAKPTEGR